MGLQLPRRRFLAITGSAALVGLAAACGDDDAPSGTAPSGPTPSGSTPSSAVPDPTDVVITRWRQDPFTFGSYSYLAVGATPEDRVALAAPIGETVFFAGEATHADFPATVHGALLSGRDAARQVLERGATTVAVVGAGAAGLAAAADLSSAGVDVTVIEARDRTGGRVATDRSLDVALENGASWIHGPIDNPLTPLAADAGVDTAVTDFEDIVVRDDEGRIVDDADLPRSFLEVAAIEQDYAADVGDLSPEATEEGDELDGGDALVVGGYDRVLEELGGDYRLRLSTTVERIAHGDTAMVVTDDGTDRYDAVVVTLPLGVLKAGTVEFDPPLPEAKAAAIGSLGMGLLDKVQLRFPEVFWEPDVDVIGHLGPDRGRFATFVNLAPVLGEPILLAFNAGSVAEEIELLDDDAIVAEATGALRRMYGTG